MINDLKEFFKQEFDDFMSQIHDVWFFLGIITSIAIMLISLNWAFSDSDKAREMRKPSTEYREKYSSCKGNTIHITKKHQKSKEIE